MVTIITSTSQMRWPRPREDPACPYGTDSKCQSQVRPGWLPNLLYLPGRGRPKAGGSGHASNPLHVRPYPLLGHCPFVSHPPPPHHFGLSPESRFHCLSPSVTPELNEQGLGGSWEALRHPFPSKRNSQGATSWWSPSPHVWARFAHKTVNAWIRSQPNWVQIQWLWPITVTTFFKKKCLSWDRHFTSGFLHDFYSYLPLPPYWALFYKRETKGPRRETTGMSTASSRSLGLEPTSAPDSTVA